MAFYYRCAHCGHRVMDNYNVVRVTLVRHGGMECPNCGRWLGKYDDYIKTKD